MNKLILSASLFLALCSCTTPHVSNLNQQINVDGIEQLSLGSTKEAVIAMFGKPAHKYQGNRNGGSYEFWSYNGKEPFRYQRLSISFNREGLVESKGISLFESDPESKLVYLEKKYGPPVSPPHRVQSCVPHIVISDNLQYRFPNGLTAAFRETRQEVSDLFWEDPIKRDLSWAKPRNCTPRKIVEIQ